ncbi:MAG: hypothetical protein FJZ01_09990, partial [Candidatus Sericytochromatia bacterium]|nr:hypothetical protein [Candidatus Tanganyikabacteria bacterium]
QRHLAVVPPTTAAVAPTTGAAPPAESAPRPAGRDPRAWSRPRPDAPLQTGWIPVDEDGQAPKIEAPKPAPRIAEAGEEEAAQVMVAAGEPAPENPAIVSYGGISFVEQTGNPAFDVSGGSLTFSDPGSGLVFASVASGERASTNYSLGFTARTESGAWQLAVDGNPRARSEGERAGTVVSYRVGDSPGLRVTRHGKKLVSSAAFQVDLDWHEIRALLSGSSLALYVDRAQVLVLQRGRPTSWVGLGGTGEFKDLVLKPR